MPGKPVYDWPSDEDLAAGVAEHGQSGFARKLGVSRTGLQSRLRERGIKVTRRPPKSVEDNPVPVDDPERLRMQRLEDDNKRLKKDNAEYAKRLASEETFFERIVEATRISVEAPKIATRKQSGSLPTQSVITPLYDFQFGQFVRPSDTPGNQGGFSVDVFDRRLERWIEGVKGVVSDRAASYKLQELIVPFGGDQVEGDEIFSGQAWQLEIDPPRQVWELACKMDAAMQEVIRWAKEEVGIPYVSLYGITGNHGKVGGKRGGARPATYNWDWLFLKILFDRLREQPIDQFAIEPGGALFFYCAGHEFQAIHGDQIRGWGGLPFYGLTRFDARSVRLHSRLYRYLLMGHHHQSATIPNGAGETIVSGDWVGANNLSGMMTAASRPQQNVLFVSRKWGLAGVERIYFAEAEDSYAQTEIHGRAA